MRENLGVGKPEIIEVIAFQPLSCFPTILQTSTTVSSFSGPPAHCSFRFIYEKVTNHIFWTGRYQLPSKSLTSRRKASWLKPEKGVFVTFFEHWVEAKQC